MPPKKSTPYYIHHLGDKNLDKKEIIIASIDPGTVNYALTIEKVGKDRSGKVFYMSRTHLNPPRKKNDIPVSDKYVAAYANLNILLKNQLELLKTCDLIIIEKQMPFNYKATRISQHTIAFMTLMLDQDPAIIEIEPRVKSLILKKKGDEPNNKIWSVIYAKKILELRGDTETLEKIEIERKIKKADDVCDVIVQAEGYLELIKWFDDCEEEVDEPVKKKESKTKKKNKENDDDEEEVVEPVKKKESKTKNKSKKTFDKESFDMLEQLTVKF